jgi:hypothetical protein
MGNEKATITAQGQEVRPYETPTIRVMDENEVLSAFQVTVAGITWWVM